MSLNFSIEKECDCCGHVRYESFNITHNLANMASEAGVYRCLWRPKEDGYVTAAQIIPLLENAIVMMNEGPTRFKVFNASNGWGDYEGLLNVIGKILAECKKNPTYLIKADV